MIWYQSWFDTPYYHILYSNRDYSEAEDFITKLTAAIRLPDAAKIIDLACGRGRHSVYLNKLGYDVLGLDLSEKSIAFDRQFENEKLKFSVHDMREPIDHPPVDAVLNLFTSFGYFETDEEDRAVFSSVAAALKNDGIFVLDFMNAPYVADHMVGSETVERRGISFDIKRRIEGNFIYKDIRFTDQGKDYYFFEKVKLHTSKNILDLAQEAGFACAKTWGNYQLNTFDEKSSPRCIHVFIRKK